MPDPIPTDLPCCVCSYNLKGLDPGANCPECGQRIARTFTYDLTHADPNWLRYQARAVPFVGALMLLAFTPASSRYVQLLSGSLALLAAGVNVWACHRLGRPDPAALIDLPDTFRRGVRLVSILLALVTALAALSETPSRARLTSWTATAGVQFLIAINLALALLLIAHLARRSEDPTLHRHARLLLFTLPAFPCIYALLYTADLRPVLDVMYYLMTLINWAASAAGFAFLILLGRVYETLRTAARTADNAVLEPAPLNPAPPEAYHDAPQ